MHEFFVWLHFFFLGGGEGSGEDFGSILERFAGVWARFFIDLGEGDGKKHNSCMNLCIFGFSSILDRFFMDLVGFWDFRGVCLF